MNTLMQYVRKQRGGQQVRSGVLLAKKVKTKTKTGKRVKRVLVGWSKCKLTVDEFDRKRGVEIAEGRIQSRLETAKKTKVPPSIKEQVKTFVERCKQYFKTKEVKVV